MRRLFSQKGTTILETMVALGLLGIGAYFLVGVLRTGSLGQKTLLSQDDARILTENISSLLSDPIACENTFGGIAGSDNPPVKPNVAGGVSVPNIVDVNMKKQFIVGQVYGNRGLKLVGVVIGGNSTDIKTSMQHWTPGAPPPAPPSGIAFVQVNWQQTGATTSQSGPQQLYRFFMVRVTSMDAASGNIKSCTAQAGGADSTNFWSINDTNDIYNNNGSGLGKVGIGTTTPKAALDVEGSGGVLLNSGHVGIGTETPETTLDVRGEIRPGGVTLGSPCTAKGAQGYDKLTYAPVFCSGLQIWVGLSLPLPGTAGSQCTSPAYPNNKGITHFEKNDGPRLCCGNDSIGNGGKFFYCEPY